MTSARVAVYLSEHGFGHAMRSVWLLGHLAAAMPDLQLLIATRLPRWLLAGLERAERVEAMALPPPLVQADSLTVDHAASGELLSQVLAAWDDTVHRHAAWLRQIGADLVYSDVPAQPLAAAQAAGIAGVALGNFTWDWIYRHYADVDRRYVDAARVAAEAYRTARLYLQLPTAPTEPSGMPTAVIPWVGRRPRRSRRAVRDALGLSARRPMVLLSFGGHPTFPLAELLRSSWARRFHWVGGRQLDTAASTLHRVDEEGLAAAGIGYIDLVAAADVVVSKPGYGILADCLFTGSRLVYLARPEFPEASLLLEPTMDRLLQAVAVAPGERTAAAIGQAVDQCLGRPAPEPTERLDGVEVATARLQDLLP